MAGIKKAAEDILLLKNVQEIRRPGSYKLSDFESESDSDSDVAVLSQKPHASTYAEIVATVKNNPPSEFSKPKTNSNTANPDEKTTATPRTNAFPTASVPAASVVTPPVVPPALSPISTNPASTFPRIGSVPSPAVACISTVAPPALAHIGKVAPPPAHSPVPVANNGNLSL